MLEKKISKIWKKLAKKHNLQISIFGLSALINMKFNSKYNLEYKTLISQEMLKKDTWLPTASMHVPNTILKYLMDMKML